MSTQPERADEERRKYVESKLSLQQEDDGFRLWHLPFGCLGMIVARFVLLGLIGLLFALLDWIF